MVFVHFGGFAMLLQVFVGCFDVRFYGVPGFWCSELRGNSFVGLV